MRRLKWAGMLLAVALPAAAQRRRDPVFALGSVPLGDRWFCTAGVVGALRITPCFRDPARCDEWRQERRDRGENAPPCRESRTAQCVTYHQNAEDRTVAVCMRDVAACNAVRRFRFQANRLADRYPNLHGDDATSAISECSPIGTLAMPAPQPESEGPPAPPLGPMIVPPDGLAREVVARVLERAAQLAGAARCLPPGEHHVRVTFDRSGTALAAERPGDPLTEAQAACLVDASTRAAMPPFNAPRFSITYPFTTGR